MSNLTSFSGQDPVATPENAAKPSQGQAAVGTAAKPEFSLFHLRVGDLYEGPFDLLLDLIRRQNINIYDIPIAAITAQYLRYLETLRELDVEVAAEFLMVAATLIHIKSRMLLPAEPVLPGEIAVDPREELVQRLIEHEKYKQAAALLHERQRLEAASWSRAGMRDYPEHDEPGELVTDIYDLVSTLQQVLRRLEERPRIEITREQASIPAMMAQVHRLLSASERPIALRPLLEEMRSREALLALFLALLELVRLGVTQFYQQQAFGEIWLRRHAHFHEAWAQYLAQAEPEPGARQPA